MRRHRLWGATAAAFVLVLVSGAVVSTWQAVRARRAEALATSRLAESQQEAAKSKAVNAFLQTMLSVDPTKMKGRDVTVRQVLDDAAKTVGGEALTKQPLVAAAVRTTLGETYQALGLYPQAEPHLREALTIRQAALGAEHPDVADALGGPRVAAPRQGRRRGR